MECVGGEEGTRTRQYGGMGKHRDNRGWTAEMGKQTDNGGWVSSDVEAQRQSRGGGEATTGIEGGWQGGTVLEGGGGQREKHKGEKEEHEVHDGDSWKTHALSQRA